LFKKRIIPILLLIAYLFLLIKILVLKDLAMVQVGQMRFNFGGTQEGTANLIPFKTILFYLQGHNGFLIAFINIIGNIVALVPLGLLLPFVLQKLNWKKILLLSFVAGLAIELVQMCLHIGIFDIDDVILNGLGVIVGYWKFKIFSNFSKKTRTIIIAAVFSILGIGFSLCTLSYYKVIALPIGISTSIERETLPQLQSKPESNGDCCDLCRGTGGTGQIINIGNSDITIKSRRGKDELIHITSKTQIRNSKGSISKLELQLGDKVTVIIDESETASLILVCGIAK
jgi:glycopeptide antibiotics resistance protein